MKITRGAWDAYNLEFQPCAFFMIHMYIHVFFIQHVHTNFKRYSNYFIIYSRLFVCRQSNLNVHLKQLLVNTTCSDAFGVHQQAGIITLIILCKQYKHDNATCHIALPRIMKRKLETFRNNK